MLDSIILGRVVDFEVNEIDQCDLNAESLYLYDQNCLLDSVKTKVSKYDLLYYYDVLSEAPADLWKLLLRNMIEYYSLNSLKSLLTDSFDNSISEEVRNLFFFIKIKMSDMIGDLRIENKNYSKESVLYLIKDLLKKETTPRLFKYALQYTDRESLNNLTLKLMLEQKETGDD